MMKNKSLIKSIKSDVKKQIESDIKNSVVKELQSSSNKQIKKLRKQILAEVKEEMFGVSKTREESPKDQVSLLSDAVKKDSNEGTLEYQGFKFDRARMSSLVTGQDISKKSGKSDKPVKKGPRPSDRLPSELKNILMQSNKINKAVNAPKPLTADNLMMEMLPTQAGNFTRPDGSTTFPMGVPAMPTVPNIDDILRSVNSSSSFGKSLVKVPTPNLTDEKKEEIAFFIGKLKDGVSKLRKDERNIKYRKKHEGVYSFEFDRKADFDLKFNIELNLNTYRADIKAFEFKIDDYKFDKRQFELLDIVIVLDTVGFNINGHINEIEYINEIDTEQVSIPTNKAAKVNKKHNIQKPKVKATSKRLGIGKFIEDEKIVSLLKNNEILNLGQILAVEDLTSLKGIGAKTADKINKYLKSNTHGVL